MVLQGSSRVYVKVCDLWKETAKLKVVVTIKDGSTNTFRGKDQKRRLCVKFFFTTLSVMLGEG